MLQSRLGCQFWATKYLEILGMEPGVWGKEGPQLDRMP